MNIVLCSVPVGRMGVLIILTSPIDYINTILCQQDFFLKVLRFIFSDARIMETILQADLDYGPKDGCHIRMMRMVFP